MTTPFRISRIQCFSCSVIFLLLLTGALLQQTHIRTIQQDERLEFQEVMLPKKKQDPVLPNVLLIGAQKAGTSTLAEWFFRNGVCKANVFPNEPKFYHKEVHFFDEKDRYTQGVDFYAKRFEHCRARGGKNYSNPYSTASSASLNAIVDLTPSYLRHASKVSSLYNEWTDAKKALKILVILREPVAREMSRYNHMRFLNFTVLPSFDEFTDLVLVPCFLKVGNNNKDNNKNKNDTMLLSQPCPPNFGYYSKHLKEWFKLFDRSQILIVSYNELQRDPTSTLSRIQKFLGDTMISPDAVNSKLQRSNAQERPDKVSLPSCVSQTKLRDIFAPWNEELYELLLLLEDEDEESNNSSSSSTFEERPFPRFQLGECHNGTSY
jgi:hypothetical protein